MMKPWELVYERGAKTLPQEAVLPLYSSQHLQCSMAFFFFQE